MSAVVGRFSVLSESASRRLKDGGDDIRTSCTVATVAVVASVTYRQVEDSYFGVAVSHLEGCCK
jgi:hypothetical protein